ncbi:hypothetical protein Syun_005500 [Stephania yunnanensis]|uniref:Syringolide-induced protein 14-1-1 n=1 Tax=Stephania yunnanensis TaxID=152371 RepID=A0AAP0L6B6_9MAGN
MEKPAKALKGRIFSFLPKTATVSFQNPPFSPGRDKRVTENSSKFFKPCNNGHKSFSGPIISIIPVEARTKSKNGFGNEEPTSPKVSCIGQIKHKNKICKANSRVNPKSQTPQNQKPKQKSKKPSSDPAEKVPKRSSSSIRNIFRGAITGRKSTNCVEIQGNCEENRGPSLGQMKTFASGRSGLGDFDWRKYCSDDENGRSEEEEEEKIIIPHSAPLMVGEGRVALEPRKEVNLWKRRTLAPIRTLEIN